MPVRVPTALPLHRHLHRLEHRSASNIEKSIQITIVVSNLCLCSNNFAPRPCSLHQGVYEHSASFKYSGKLYRTILAMPQQTVDCAYSSGGPYYSNPLNPDKPLSVPTKSGRSAHPVVECRS